MRLKQLCRFFVVLSALVVMSPPSISEAGGNKRRTRTAKIALIAKHVVRKQFKRVVRLAGLARLRKTSRPWADRGEQQKFLIEFERTKAHAQAAQMHQDLR